VVQIETALFQAPVLERPAFLPAQLEIEIRRVDIGHVDRTKRAVQVAFLQAGRRQYILHHTFERIVA
jgi:hypothetical protein